MTNHTDTPASSADQADWEAIARFLAGESDAVEAERLRGVVGATPDQARMIAGLKAAMGRTDFTTPAGLDVESALASVRGRLHADAVTPISAARPPRGAWGAAAGAGWRRLVPRAAAAVVLIAGATWVLTLRRGESSAAERTVATAVGQRQTVALPDGSSAILGPSSELVIGAGYADGARTVRLRGKALFTVKHDGAHPFAVEAQRARITDIGTEFSVTSDVDNGVTVAVREGAVELRTSADGAPSLLRPGDRAVVGRDAGATIVRGGASDDDFAFTRGALVFRDSPIAQVVAEVRRWYGVELVPGTVAMSSRHVTATFSNESRAEALQVIALALGADVEMRGDSALLRPRILRPPR